MGKPKCIILNGYAGSGKSTIANIYIDNHPMALNIEGDRLMVNIGQQKKQYKRARKLIPNLTKAMLDAHLKSGHDVVIPYLVIDPEDISEFEVIAKANNADFFEFILFADRKTAIEGLFKRGTWGESDADPLKKKDMPKIEKLYNNMMLATEKRPNMIYLNITKNDAVATYKELISSIGE